MTQTQLRDPVHFYNERGHAVGNHKHMVERIKKLEARIAQLEVEKHNLAIRCQFLMSITDDEDLPDDDPLEDLEDDED